MGWKPPPFSRALYVYSVQSAFSPLGPLANCLRDLSRTDFDPFTDETASGAMPSIGKRIKRPVWKGHEDRSEGTPEKFV